MEHDSKITAGKEEKSDYRYGSEYEKYYDRVLVKEEPFYRTGMTKKEARRELDYLNDHLDAFYEGSYIPLWRQDLYK